MTVLVIFPLFMPLLIALLCYGVALGYLSIGLGFGFGRGVGRFSPNDLFAGNRLSPAQNSTTINKVLLLALIGAGLLAHALMLYPKIVTLYGLNFNLFNMVSLTSLFMLAFYWVFCLYRPILTLGVLAIPLAMGGAVIGFGDAPYRPLSHLSFSLQLHIIVSLAAYCVLFMAAVQAIMLRLQMRELKHQTIHRIWVNKLPALQSMESLLFDMITLGFVLLSLALGLGFVDTQDLLGQHLVHKTVFSLLSWLVFGALLFGHWRFGWRGLRAANMTIYGVILLGLAFIGTKFVLELILKR